MRASAGGVGDGDERGERLGVGGRGEHGALGGDRAHQQRQRHQERDQHQRGRGRGEQQHPPRTGHPPSRAGPGVGAASRTPTPRTLCR